MCWWRTIVVGLEQVVKSFVTGEGISSRRDGTEIGKLIHRDGKWSVGSVSRITFFSKVCEINFSKVCEINF